MRGAEREDDRVFGRGGLQLKIELTTKALPQRESPGPVQPAAERRVYDQLLAAAFIKEPFDDQGLLSRHHPKRDPGSGEVLYYLFGRGLTQLEFFDKPFERQPCILRVRVPREL